MTTVKALLSCVTRIPAEHLTRSAVLRRSTANGEETTLLSKPLGDWHLRQCRSYYLDLWPSLAKVLGLGQRRDRLSRHLISGCDQTLTSSDSKIDFNEGSSSSEHSSFEITPPCRFVWGVLLATFQTYGATDINVVCTFNNISDWCGTKPTRSFNKVSVHLCAFASKRGSTSCSAAVFLRVKEEVWNHRAKAQTLSVYWVYWEQLFRSTIPPSFYSTRYQSFFRVFGLLGCEVL